MVLGIVQLLLIPILCAFVESTTVQTKYGKLSGTTYTTVEGKTVTAFLGVPYAKPPVGELRFKEPQALDNWDGVRNAHTFGPECVQINYYELHSTDPVTGEEDCLVLDIFTPSVSSSDKLDVIFHIHGGGFMFSSGHDFLPDFILQRHPDVVFVSINYRLGPFGFLSTEDSVVPGNNGLKDQALALKWVYDNIEYFGGDKNKITIAGLSAGGSSVHFHYFSPLSRNLFQRGISASGSAFCPWAMAENNREKAQILANSLDCSGKDSKKIIDCMRKKPANSILLKVKELFMPYLYNPFSPFAAVVEPPSETAFLSKHPYEMLREGDVKDAPWVASVTTEEGLFPASYFVNDEQVLRDLDEKWNKYAPYLLDYNFTIPSEHLDEVSERVRHFYLGGKKISKDNVKELVQMMGDRLFVVDIEKAARMQAAKTSSPVYFYSFGHRGKYSITNVLCKCRPPVHLGASHADDTLFVMHTLFNMLPLETEEDKKMVDIMVGVWRSFARSGVPSLGNDVEWTPITAKFSEKTHIPYAMIHSSKNIQQRSSLDLGNAEFWNSLPFEELSSFKKISGRHNDEL